MALAFSHCYLIGKRASDCSDTDSEASDAIRLLQDEQTELAKAIAQLTEKFAPTPEKQVIAKISGRKRKIHFALVGGLDENPLDWRTRCGYCYSGWRFSRHESTEGFPPDALCRNCFPVNEEVVHQIEHDPSCSSSASSDETT